MNANFPVPLSGTDNVLMWADEADVEPAARTQIRNAAALPWTRRVAVMPDVHLGKGATVGSVIAMAGAVAPAAVGVDIGCGMSAVRTDLLADDLPDDLGRLRRAIEAAIPVGFAGHRDAAPLPPGPLADERDALFAEYGDLRADRIAERESRAWSQCGSLGGGNHFIEVTVQRGGAHDGTVWLMLHSGSRNIGNELAQRHIDGARGLSHNAGLPDRDLAVFLARTPAMDAYLHDLWWAQRYARLNRDVMMALLQDVVRRVIPRVRYLESVSCHHNYVALETHPDDPETELVVTRKGAIAAHRGTMGLIPGSMGTGSYVVRGLGNADALSSASHGAGRRMSRNKARKTFTLDDLARQTAGVECRKDGGVLDEIPGSYKDLEAVIAAQTAGESPLVEVVARLETLLCVKG